MRAESDRRLTFSSVRGRIDRNPEDAKSRIDKGEYTGILKDTDIEKLYNEIEQKKRDLRSDEEYAYQIKQREKKVAEDKVLQGWNEDLDKSKLTFKTITDHDEVSPENQRLYRALLQSKIDAPIKPNVSVFLTTLEDIRRPDGDPKKITDADDIYALVFQKKIPLSGQYSAKELIDHLSYDKSPEGRAARFQENEFMSVAKQQILNKDAAGIADPKGPSRWEAFNQFHLEQRQRMKDEKKSPSNLYNPKSPDYIGAWVKPEALDQKIKNMAAALGGDAPRPRPFTENPSGGFTNVSPESSAAREPKALSDKQRHYNQLVGRFGGNEDQMYGPNGEEPKMVHEAAANWIEKMAARDAEIAQYKVGEEQARKQRQQDKISRELKKQNKLREKLGLSPKTELTSEPTFALPIEEQPLNDDKMVRAGESPAQYLQRMEELKKKK
jgi:hypothetical protein